MTIDRARELLKGATKAKRDELRKTCEALIATWDWGSFMRHHVEPDFMLRHKWRRGSPLPVWSTVRAIVSRDASVDRR